MALIEVSELLSDPDFLSPIVIITRIPSIDSLGQNHILEEALETVGCVQPATGRALLRVPEALREANMMNFWFRGKIVATAPGKYSSILVFQGERFQVKNVFDWSNWGPGYCEGLCVAERPSQ